MAGPFQQRTKVFGWSERRPLNDKRPIGSAITEVGAKRVYWKWEQDTFPQGERWYPKSMIQDVEGNWFLGDAVKR